MSKTRAPFATQRSPARSAVFGDSSPCSLKPFSTILAVDGCDDARRLYFCRTLSAGKQTVTLLQDSAKSGALLDLAPPPERQGRSSPAR